MKNFFRKVAFGLKPDEKIPSDPLVWATSQITDEIPDFSFKGRFILKKNYGNITKNGYLTIEKNLEKNLRKIKKDTNLLKIN